MTYAPKHLFEGSAFASFSTELVESSRALADGGLWFEELSNDMLESFLPVLTGIKLNYFLKIQHVILNNILV